MNNLAQKIFLILLCLVFIGASDISIIDVEEAIMKEEYEKAKTLSLTLMEKGVIDAQKNQVRYYYGLSLLSLKQTMEARQVFGEIVKSTKRGIDKTFFDKAQLGIIDSYFMDDQYDKALSASKKFLRVSSQSDFLSLIYFKSARAYAKQAKWEKARSFLNKVLEDFPDSPEAPLAKQLLEEKQYYAVQVGAFIEQARAQRLVSELQNKGEYSYIVETMDNEGKTFYRVRVGKLTQLNQAQDLKSKLARDGYPTMIYP